MSAHETTGRPAAPTASAEPTTGTASDAAPEPRPASAARGEPAGGDQASEDVMRLLSEHVPLTLLADLAQPTGPDSPEILEDEGLPAVAWWQSAADDGR